MKQKIVPSKWFKGRGRCHAGDAKSDMVDGQYLYLDHGVCEHGFDWDDWLRMGRALDQKAIEENRVIQS